MHVVDQPDERAPPGGFDEEADEAFEHGEATAFGWHGRRLSGDAQEAANALGDGRFERVALPREQRAQRQQPGPERRAGVGLVAASPEDVGAAGDRSVTDLLEQA